MYKSEAKLALLMQDSPAAQAKSNFVCSCEDWMRLACQGIEKWGAVNGKDYCVFHFPNDKPMLGFMRAFKEKLDSTDYNFTGFRFPPNFSFLNLEFEEGAFFSHALFMGDVTFQNVVFNAEVDFLEATFVSDLNMMNASFRKRAMFIEASFHGDADFSSATFVGPLDFTNATFDRVAIFNADFEAQSDFAGTSFNGYADFGGSKFTGDVTFFGATFNSVADFGGASFQARATFPNCMFAEDVDFSYSTFASSVDFSDGTFRSYVSFRGSQKEAMFGPSSSLSLEFAKIHHADRVSFYSVLLRPSWFANVTISEFEFLDVRWRFRFGEEISALAQRGVSSPHTTLSKIFRDVAINCEANHRYYLASRFRYWAMDASRQISWWGFPFWKLSWWYWFASGYGENSVQALAVLLLIWLAMSAVYTKVGFIRWEPRVATEADAVIAQRDNVGTPLELGRALTYSAAVMTLQKPEPKPATPTAHTTVLLETILGPVQAALLALAIRRKFMR